jgi:hypothetical protein
VDLAALEAPPVKIIAETAILLRLVARTPATGRPAVARAANCCTGWNRWPATTVWRSACAFIRPWPGTGPPGTSCSAPPDMPMSATMRCSTARWPVHCPQRASGCRTGPWNRTGSITCGARRRPAAAVIARTTLGATADLLTGSRDDL